MALTTTPGASDATSYASLTEAEAYMATLVHKDAWTEATDPAKEAALQQATRLLDTLTWKGRKATAEQALAWPRTGVTDRDGYEVDPAAIPAVVAYNRFAHDIDRLGIRFESFMEEFSNILQRNLR